MMRKFWSRSQVVVVLIAGMSLVVTGCGQVGTLQSRLAVRDAHALYQRQDYRAAAEKYEEAISHDPNLTEAYFFLGNSYDNLFRPARRGDPANDELLVKAVENYKKAASFEDQDPKIRQLTLEYLVAAYGPDKLNDPSQQEPIVLEMINLSPNEPTNYHALAGIYENNGDYEAAEQAFLKAKEARPSEPTVYTQLAAFYNRQGDFENTIAALRERAEREPNNPEAHHVIATYYWDKVYRDFRLSDDEKREFIQAGIASVDRAIQLKDDYFEAVTYKNLLLRSQALVEKDPGVQRRLLEEADRLRDEAQELRKRQQLGAPGD